MRPFCRDLKSDLLRAEEERTGRVKLPDFYKVGAHGYFNFTETPEYLRDLGVLDESTAEPRVIISNYVSSRPNCLAASTVYMVCCRNACEDIMGELEREIGVPTASADHIAELMESLPSHTLHSKGLPIDLRNQLDLISKKNNGEVPLHGRAFAQWMHKAFPLECPRPHEEGAAALGPQTPDEWQKEAPETVTVSDEELKSLKVAAVATDVQHQAAVDGRSPRLRGGQAR